MLPPNSNGHAKSFHSRRIRRKILTHEATGTTTSLCSAGLALHLLRDLYVDFEEFGHAAVEADRLALVKIGFAVGWWDALLGARLDKAIHKVSVPW